MHWTSLFQVWKWLNKMLVKIFLITMIVAAVVGKVIELDRDLYLYLIDPDFCDEIIPLILNIITFKAVLYCFI